MDNILQGKKVVVVDDEFVARKLLDLIFSGAGATIQSAAGYEEGMRLLENFDPDLVLIDIMMPQVDGLTMCHRVRQISTVPIIIVTAKNRPEDVISGLRAGADDYVVKPYEAKVLVERARALLRRVQSFQEGKFKDNYLYINLPDQIVMIEGQPVNLSKTEYNLLALLVNNAKKSCTYSQIVEHIWDEDRSHRPEYIDAYIFRLRQKIEKNPRYPSYIVKDQNDGYRFVIPEI